MTEISNSRLDNQHYAARLWPFGARIAVAVTVAGRGATEADRDMLALAPEMAEAILHAVEECSGFVRDREGEAKRPGFRITKSCEKCDHVAAVAEKLRALSRPAEEANR